MKRLVLILLLIAGSAIAQSKIHVLPETVYPIIDRSSAVTLAQARSECLPPTESDPVARCTIKKFGDLGSVEGVNYFYVIYEWLDQGELSDYKAAKMVRYPHSNTVLILFYSDSTAPNMLHPFFSDRNDFGTGWFEEPRLLHRTEGMFLQIPHRAESSADSEPDMLLRWRDQAWHVIDTQSWLEDLQSRLPQDCSVIHTPVINFTDMTSATMVWKSSDDRCCPTCGKIYAELALQDDHLIIQGIRYDLKAVK
jgi:hypothetical protein